jgi:hypothetical protein
MIACRLGVYGVSNRPAAVASRNLILSDRREFPVFKCEKTTAATIPITRSQTALALGPDAEDPHAG